MAKLGNLYYDITLDDGQLRAALQRVKAELKGMDNQIVSLSQNAGGKQLTNSFDLTGKTIEQVKNQMNALVQVYNKLDMTGNAADAEKVRQRWLELQQVLASYGVTVRNATMESRTFSQVQAMESNTIAQITAKMQALVAARARENVNTAQGRQNVSAINAEYQRLNRTLQDLGVRQRNFNDGIFNMGRIANEVKGQIQSVYSIYALERFIQKMVDVRSQFELQQTSLRAILQDKYTADKIFAQVVDLGLKSPFTTMELDGYVKQLAAYRIETETLFDTTKRLADVSAGLGVDMQRLILAYGQVRAASVLRGQEVRQFTEAGIPLIEALADKFTELKGTVVSTSEVFDMISKRMVSFEMVKEIFEDMTNAGGIFYNMQEIQSETLYGKIQNLGDAFDLAFNKLGKANEGVLKGSVDLLWKMAENFDVVVSSLTTLIALYGTYRAVLLVTNTLMGQNTLGEYASALIQTARNLGAATAAQTAFNTAAKANIYAAIATALLALGYALYTYATRVDESTKFTNEFNRELSNETDKLDILFGKIKETTAGTKERADAVQELTSKYGNYLKGINLEIANLAQLADAQELANEKLRENIRLKKLDERKTELGTQFKDETDNAIQTIQSTFRSLYGATAEGQVSARLEQAIYNAISKKNKFDVNKIQQDLFKGFNTKDVDFKAIQAVSSNLYKIRNEVDKYSSSIQDAEIVTQSAISEIDKLTGKVKPDIIDFRPQGKSVGELEDALKQVNKQIGEISKHSVSADFERLQGLEQLAKSIQSEIKVSEKAINTDSGIDDRIKALKEEQSTLDRSSKEYAEYAARIEFLERRRGKGKYSPQKLESAQQKADRDSAKKILETETQTNNEYKRKLELVEQVRKAYTDLNTQALALNNNTDEGRRISEEALSKIPNQLKSLFTGEEYQPIINDKLYDDDNYKKYLNDLISSIKIARDKVVTDLDKLKSDVTDSNKETVANYIVTLTKSLTDVDLEAWWNEYNKVIDQQKKAIDARNKLFSEEPPEGTGFAFRLSKIMTDVRNDVTQKGKEITSALVGATDEQKAALEQLGQAWTDAYNEEGMQKAEKLAQSYFNEFLKKQKLDIDMGSLSSATMSQLNRLRDALKAIETEFTGKGLVDAFDAVGLSIENLKGYIDTTNLSTVKKSLSDLISFTPEDIQLSEEQKKQLEAILKIVNTLYQNNKKGLFDIDLEKLKKFKDIADEVASAFGEIGSALEELGEATGNEGLSSLAQDMQFASEMAGNIGNIVVGIMSKDPKAIIQGVVGIATTLIKGEAAYQKARLEFLKQQRSLQTDYNALLIEQIRLQKEGANGVLFDDLIENFRAAFNASEAAIKQLNDLYTKGTIKISSGSAIQDLINPKYKPTENIEEYLSSIMVQTGTKRKKFMGITTGSTAVYGDLLTAYPALIDETGQLDLEYAKLIVSQNNFKGQGKEALEELIAYTEQYEEAMQEMDDQLNSMFGGIGSLISDALISSFQNGKLSAKDFFDTVNEGIGDMLDSLVSNMVMAAVFGDMLDEYQQAIKDALLSDDPQANLTDLMGNLVGDIKKGYDDAAAAMDLYNDAKQKAGLGSVNDVAREGLSEGYAKATQESIDVLTGVTYAALEKLSITANNTNAINMNVSAMSAELQTQTAILRSIDSYASNIPYIKTGIDTMVNRGVKLQ